MGFVYANNAIDVDIVSNANITSTGGSSSVLDLVNVEGSLLAFLSVRASGTATMTTVIEHSESSGSGFTTVSASAVIDPDTGDADAFDDVSTSASEQIRGLRRDLLKRYIRFTFSGTGLDQNVSAGFVFQKKYTDV